MHAVLTFLNGKTQETSVPDPAPSVFILPAPFDITKLGINTPKDLLTEKDVIKFILAGTESGAAEYFEEGLPDTPELALYQGALNFMSNKHEMVQTIKQFELGHPDLKEYEPALVDLAQKFLPMPDETTHEYLDRLYKKHKLRLAAQGALEEKLKAQIALQEAIEKKAVAEEASKELKWMEKKFGQEQIQQWAGMMGDYKPVTTTQAVPHEMYGYQEDLGTTPPASQPQKPEKKIPEVEMPKGRLIVLKKKG